MAIISSMLKTVSIFSGLNTQQLAEIERHAVFRTHPKNTIVLSEGDTSASLYVILSGRVKIYLDDENGKEVTINHQSAGEYFGELSLIDDSERSASVVTVEKSAFAIISKSAFRRVLTENPDIAIHLLEDLAQRVRNLTGNVKTLALSDVYGRLSKLLLSLAVERDGVLVVAEHLTQQDIANRIGSSREMVSRILKELVSGGYIAVDHKHTSILKHLPQHY
ncbi:cAMP-binding proteins - catabolite gene activator and regulatory subunit of cAMP-dependent protein kinases [hydrothermal vent metagenome]|uniref:cAMP-binding proteins - catabolite gene activator and regulatory subunit of cAMP-dependent protein kinases n=1 Tax=hydrothermal vent metagenome TaxID=652676 RepID=A0A3B0ZL30_9ZZZZ